MDVLRIELVPETWVLGIRLPKEELLQYAEKGWITKEDAEHLDRAFRRNAKGQAIILKHQLMVCLNKARKMLNEKGIISREKPFQFEIIDDFGLPVGYIVVDKPPLKTRIHVVTETGEESTEYFEYLSSVHTIKFDVVVKEGIEDFVKTLAFAGMAIGLGPKGARGFGRFRIQVGVVEKGGEEFDIEIRFKKRKK